MPDNDVKPKGINTIKTEDNTQNSGILVRFTKHFLWCYDPGTGEYFTLTDGKEREYSRSEDMLAGWVSFWEGVDCFVRRRIAAAKETNNTNSGRVIARVMNIFQWCLDPDTGEFYTLIEGKEPEMRRSADKLTAWDYFYSRVDMYVRQKIWKEREKKNA